MLFDNETFKRTQDKVDKIGGPKFWILRILIIMYFTINGANCNHNNLLFVWKRWLFQVYLENFLWIIWVYKRYHLQVENGPPSVRLRQTKINYSKVNKTGKSQSFCKSFRDQLIFQFSRICSFVHMTKKIH